MPASEQVAASRRPSRQRQRRDERRDPSPDSSHAWPRSPVPSPIGLLLLYTLVGWNPTARSVFRRLCPGGCCRCGGGAGSHVRSAAGGVGRTQESSRRCGPRRRPAFVSHSRGQIKITQEEGRRQAIELSTHGAAGRPQRWYGAPGYPASGSLLDQITSLPLFACVYSTGSRRPRSLMRCLQYSVGLARMG